MGNKKNIAIKAVAAIYLAMLALATVFVFEFMFKNPTIEYHDFAKYYCGAKIVASSESHKFYDPDFEMSEWRKLSGEKENDRKVCIEISPVWSTILIPFGNVDFRTAYLMWQGLWIGAGAIGLYCSLRSAHTSASKSSAIIRALILIVATMASLPEVRGMVLGQPCWLILGLVGGFCAAFIAKRDITAGIMLALTTVKFQYSPFLGLAALAFGRWKLIAVAAVGFLILIAGASALIGIENVINYPHTLLTWETDPELEIDINPQSMVNFRGIMSIFLNPDMAMKCSFPLMVIGLLLNFKIWLDTVKIGARAIPWALSFSIVAVLLFSAHVHMYDCILLAICAALTFPCFDFAQLWNEKPTCMKLWICLLSSYPVILWVILMLDARLLHIKVNGMNLSVVTVVAFNVINIALLILSALNLYRVARETPLVETAQESTQV